MEWFKDYKHIGYDLLGRKILKPEAGDEIDEFIEKNENPDYWCVFVIVCMQCTVTYSPDILTLNRTVSCGLSSHLLDRC